MFGVFYSRDVQAIFVDYQQASDWMDSQLNAYPEDFDDLVEIARWRIVSGQPEFNGSEVRIRWED